MLGPVLTLRISHNHSVPEARQRCKRRAQKILLDRPLPNVYFVHFEVRRALFFLARLHEKQLIAQDVLVDEAAEYVYPLIVA